MPAAAAIPASSACIKVNSFDCVVQHPGLLLEEAQMFQAHALNTSAWDNKIGLRLYFLVSSAGEMLNRDSWGIRLSLPEVNFLNLLKPEYCESICHGCRPSLNHKPRRLEIGDRYL